MHNLNLYTWHTTRQLDYCPPHFVVTSTPYSPENLVWVFEKLSGRFCLVSPLKLYAFENPAEATYYELVWS